MFNKILGPMLLGEVDKPFNDNNYIYELKYDGIRVLIYASAKIFKIITRNGNDVTLVYPELKAIQKLVGKNKVIFDGEIVAFKNGKPDFNWLLFRARLQNKVKIKQKMVEIPVYFIAFDIIYFNKDITNLTLINRKEILNSFNDTTNFMKSKIYYDGIKLFKSVKKCGLEGIVAKDKNSVYILNNRTNYWLKIKNFQKSYFWIHGYIKLKNKYRLLLGEYKNKKLYFVGNVSVTNNNLVLMQVLKQKETKNIFVNYNEPALYVKPSYKVLVYYMEKTDNSLRQPFIK